MLAAAINRDRKAAIWHFLCVTTFTVSDKILSSNCADTRNVSLNFDLKSAHFILKWLLSYRKPSKEHEKKRPVLCYSGASNVSPLRIRGIWFHGSVCIAVTLKSQKASVPSSIVLARVFPRGEKSPHPTYAHKHGVIPFHEETCMNAWKHQTGCRVLTVGVGERQQGLFNSKPAICGL